MTISKGTFMALFMVVLFGFASQTVKADLVINDNGNDQWISEFPLFHLFNEYFGTNYSSSDDLISSRGYTVSNTWTALQGAEIYNAYKVAGFAHDLQLKGNDGWIVSQQFAGNTQSSGVGEFEFLGVSIPVGTFEMSIKAYAPGFAYFLGEVTAEASNYTAGPFTGSDDMIHMIAIDVTDLMSSLLGGKEIQSAYLFCWEDMVRTYADMDYQDLAYIMVNVADSNMSSASNESNATPEPATALILLAGLGVYPLVRKLRRNING